MFLKGVRAYMWLLSLIMDPGVIPETISTGKRSVKKLDKVFDLKGNFLML